MSFSSIPPNSPRSSNPEDNYFDYDSDGFDPPRLSRDLVSPISYSTENEDPCQDLTLFIESHFFRMPDEVDDTHSNSFSRVITAFGTSLKETLQAILWSVAGIIQSIAKSHFITGGNSISPQTTSQQDFPYNAISTSTRQTLQLGDMAGSGLILVI